jgi:hypothetical protein
MAAMDERASDSFSTEELDSLSVTVCPVHALSTAVLPPGEWIEMAWAARNAALRNAKQERRGWFEGVKCLLLERDLPPSHVSHGNF